MWRKLHVPVIDRHGVVDGNVVTGRTELWWRGDGKLGPDTEVDATVILILYHDLYCSPHIAMDNAHPGTKASSMARSRPTKVPLIAYVKVRGG